MAKNILFPLSKFCLKAPKTQIADHTIISVISSLSVHMTQHYWDLFLSIPLWMHVLLSLIIMFLCLIRWACPPVFTATQQKCCEYGSFGSTRDCWLKCHTLREIDKFYWGGWSMHRVSCSASCSPFLFIASCIQTSLWCRGENRTAWMGHTHGSNMLMLANCAKTVAFVPSNSLISWARCWCFASQRGWQQQQQWSLLI